MGRRCCVANFKGNYDKQTKVKFYRLPRNLEERKRQHNIIPRDNIPDTKNIVVCEMHWPENYLAKLDYGKERPRDFPSVFTCVKPSKVPTLPPRKRSTVKVLPEKSESEQNKKI